MRTGGSRLLEPPVRMERATGIEPATSSLGSWHSAAELRPHLARILGPGGRACQITRPAGTRAVSSRALAGGPRLGIAEGVVGEIGGRLDLRHRALDDGVDAVQTSLVLLLGAWRELAPRRLGGLHQTLRLR